MRYLDLSNYQDVDPQTTIGITQEVAYSDKKQRVRLILQAMQDEDSLFQDRVSGLGKDTKYFTSVINYDYDFNLDNKLNIQLYYALYKDIFDLEKLEDISGYFSLANTYEDFDFYNGLVWHVNNLNWTNYFLTVSSILLKVF